MSVIIVGGEVFANIRLLIAVIFVLCSFNFIFLNLFSVALHCTFLASMLQLSNKLELS